MYIGSVIGAGFASGQEISQFFIVHGGNALREVILVTLLFSYLGASILYLAVKLKTNNYLSLINRLLGKKVGYFFDLLSMAMLLGGLSVMFSGSGAVFEEHLKIDAWLGIALVALINGVVMLKGLHGVLWINAILVPVKITAIFILCLLVIHTQNKTGCLPDPGQPVEKIFRSWVWSGILYVSYNMMLVLAVLATLGKSISIPKAAAGGVIGGVGLGLTAGIMCLAGIALWPKILAYKVPTIYMAGMIHESIKLPIGLLIWLAILTTAVANTHGLAARIAAPGSIKYKLAGLCVTLLAIPLSLVDFDRLVNTIYPVFGYAGLVIIAALLLAPPAMAFIKRNN
jgi:uncharacterized membrane protein YkvI